MQLLQPHEAHGPRELVDFPDLADIPAGYLGTRLSRVGATDQWSRQGETIDACLFDLVRLTEKALWAYNAARAHYARLVNGNDLVNVMACRGDAGPAVGDAVMAQLLKLKPRRKALRRLRRAVRRCDERLSSSPYASPDEGTLSIRRADIAVDGRSLSYADLERLVRKLHELTNAIASG